jgi:predicted regulator of Ras-like GTPase activity (Roadblock/LC7/MglB family)
MAKLDQLLQQFRMEIGPDLVAVEVVGMDGMSIAGGSTDPNFDTNEAAARFAMVMKLASNVTTKVGMGIVDDNLITTDRTYVLTRFIGDGSFFMSVTVSRNAILGSLRVLMNEYVPRFLEAIPH